MVVQQPPGGAEPVLIDELHDRDQLFQHAPRLRGEQGAFALIGIQGRAQQVVERLTVRALGIGVTLAVLGVAGRAMKSSASS